MTIPWLCSLLAEHIIPALALGCCPWSCQYISSHQMSTSGWQLCEEILGKTSGTINSSYNNHVLFHHFFLSEKVQYEWTRTGHYRMLNILTQALMISDHSWSLTDNHLIISFIIKSICLAVFQTLFHLATKYNLTLQPPSKAMFALRKESFHQFIKLTILNLDKYGQLILISDNASPSNKFNCFR